MGAQARPGARYELLRDEMLAVVPELTRLAVARGADAAARRLDAAERRLRDSPLTVVVCGEFKRGKSSLLNALLGEDPPLFPVNARVATSTVTTVSWADPESIQVALDDGKGGVETRTVTRADIAAYATEAGDPALTAAVGSVVVGTPNPRLASGLTVVDTPGVGGVFAEHTTATMSFLPRADAIVFVSDFTQPLLASELDFLHRATEAAHLAGDDLGALLFVVTKADAAPAADREELLRNTREKLSAVTGMSPDELTVVPVSSLAKMDYLATGDAQDLADSGFAALDTALDAIVERRRAALVLGAALGDADAACQALVRPLDDERAALEAGTRTRLAELTGQAELRRAELTELQRGKAAWRAELTRGMQVVGRDLQREARRRQAEVWHRCDSDYLHDPANLDFPEQLVDRLTADVALIAGAIGELAEQRAADVMRAFADSHGLALEHPGVGVLPAPRVPPLTITGSLNLSSAEGRNWERTKQTAQGGTVGVTIGSIVGGIVGLIGGPAGAYVGSFVGGAIGGFAGGRRSLKNATERQQHADAVARPHSIRTELAPLRTAQQFDMEENLDLLINRLVAGAGAELDGRIAQELESLGDALARLAKTSKATADEAAARRSAIDAERAPLSRITQRLAAVAAATAQLRRSATPPAESGPARGTTRAAAAAPPRPAPATVVAAASTTDWADD